MPSILLVLLALFEESTAVDLNGTVCRLNRRADRFIVQSEGKRLSVALGDTTPVTWESAPYRGEDIRLGDRVRISGLSGGGRIEADKVDVQLKVAETIVDALLGVKPPLVGRFGSREAKTEYFSFRLPDGDYIRVDAKGAYGPKGRVWVSTLNSGDLLELSGSYQKEGLYRAGGIRVLTNEESSKCARVENETKEEKEARLSEEQRFLDGYDPISDEELARLLAEDEEEEKKAKEQKKP
jgi:hypothetical protein